MVRRPWTVWSGLAPRGSVTDDVPGRREPSRDDAAGVRTSGPTTGQLCVQIPPPGTGGDGVAVPVGDRPPAPGDGAGRWRPSPASFLLAMSFSFGLTAWLGAIDPGTGPIGWYAAVVWTLPVILTVQGIAGGLHARRFAAMRARTGARGDVVSSQLLIVVVPTIGRADTHVALTRVLTSFCTCLPRCFPRLRIDVVVEEGCDMHGELVRFQSSHPLVRVVTVPRNFRTPRGTRFKARANHYAHLLRQREGETREDVWVLHMDDDTGVDHNTAAEVARFIECQHVAGDAGKHLAQGILAYPREFSRSPLTWYADAVRPGCDISLFAITTGRGLPRMGLHGELLLVRASVEAQIGWDFGSRTIVEDTEFAMRFCDAYPGRSAWFLACSYGASPANLTDFVKQRARWVWGLLTLLSQSSVPLHRRLLLLPTVALWVGAPIANPVVLVSVGLLVGAADTTPPHLVIGFIWAVNFGFYIWLYWEGFRINSCSSADPCIRWWQRIVVILGTPVFALMECLGIVSGLVRFLRRSEMQFTVIEKPV